MRKKLLIFSLITWAVGCKNSTATGPGPVNATTAFVAGATADFTSGKLVAVDLSTRQTADVLPAAVFAPDTLIRTFATQLYLIARDSVGNKNNLLVLAPETGYQPACGKGPTACQFRLPDRFDAQDFWVSGPNKMYLTAYNTADTSSPGSVSNSLQVYDPLSGRQLNSIDLAAGAKVLGDDLLNVIGDGTIDPGALYQSGRYLFVAAQMLVTGPVDPKSGFALAAPKRTQDACGFEPGRVLVVDTTTDTVVKVIKLRGANPQGPFVYEPVEAGIGNLLIATPGATASFDQEPCNGIDRISIGDQTLAGSAVSEAQMSGGDPHGGTVFAFALGSRNGLAAGGLAFVGVGTTESPDYQLVRFDTTNGRLALIADEGVKGLTQPAFIAAVNGTQAYVSLPYKDPNRASAIAAYDLLTGALVDGRTIPLTIGPTQVAFFPGPSFEP